MKWLEIKIDAIKFINSNFQMGFLEIGTTDATWLKEEYVYKL